MPRYCQPDRDHVAVLTLSAQGDYLRPESPIYNPRAKQAAAKLADVVKEARKLALPLFHSVRLYRADGSNVDCCRREAVEDGMRILMPGTSGADLAAPLRGKDTPRFDPVLLMKGKMQALGDKEWASYRPRWSAFYATDLEKNLAENKVNSLIVGGLSFATGIRATLFDASARDLRLILLTDAVAGASEEAIAELGRMGVHLMNAADCVAWLEKGAHPQAA